MASVGGPAVDDQPDYATDSIEEDRDAKRKQESFFPLPFQSSPAEAGRTCRQVAWQIGRQIPLFIPAAV